MANSDEPGIQELRDALVAAQSHADSAEHYATNKPERAAYHALQGILRLGIGALREHLAIHDAEQETPST